MFGINSTETVEKIITIIHEMHDKSTWNKIFSARLNSWYNCYLLEEGAVHYTINSILYLNTLKEKYIKFYEKLKHGLWCLLMQ